MIYGNQNQVNALSLVSTYDATIDSSTTLTLNAATRQILVTAITQPIFYKWGAAASSSSFDGIVSPGHPAMVQRPINPATGALFTTIQFIEAAATANLAVCEY